MESKNAALQRERDELNAEVTKLQRECTQLKEEITAYKKQVEDSENEHKLEVEAIQAQNQSIIEQKNDQLQQKYFELQQKNEQLQHNNDELQQMNIEVRQKNEQLQQKDDELQQKDDRIQDLLKQLERANDEVKEAGFTQLHHLQENDTFLNIQRAEVRISEEIGRGASGLVSKGTFRGLTVAVKQIHDFILTQKHVMDEFKREVRIMASVQHPNLVRFIGAVFDESVENLSATPLLILELLQSNLRRAYERCDLSISVSLSVFRDIAYGLHYLHEHQEPIIHRDVSAPNILLEALPGGMWRAKLSDFGSANFLKRSSTLGVGALIYTAPEMFPRDDPTAPVPPPTTKCDVFSYGIVLVEVLTKTMPSLKNRHELFAQVQMKWRLMYDLIIQCTQPLPPKRPTMSSILNTLNQIPIARPRKS